MRKITPFVCLLLLPLLAPAKTGFFLRPAIGLGVTNQQSKNFLIPLDGKNTLSTEYEVSVGFQTNRVAVSVGIGYLTTGFKEHYTLATAYDVNSGQPISFEEIRTKAAFRHIVVPVHISY